MKTVELKVARIGNSRGVRLPADTLHRYHIGNMVIMEERPDGILLHPEKSTDGKLSWEETARAMAESLEDWSEWSNTGGDGIEALPWNSQPGIVAEQRVSFGTKAGVKRRKQKKGGAS